MLDCIVKEIAIRKDYLSDKNISSIYFGGGTPSLLNASELATILDAVKNLFTVSATAEITLEANPEDMQLQQLQDYYGIGINRLSVGTQSFFAEDLQYMHRGHTAAEAETCVHNARKAGFKNISLDLIYGYPLLTMEKWKENLRKAFALETEHISCYAMTVEPKTILEKLIATKKAIPMNDTLQAEQFSLLMEWADLAGYEHYEISNYAKPGKRAVHNSAYWQGQAYMGIGPGAHSYNGHTRQWNVSNNAIYIAALQQGVLRFEAENLNPQQITNEYIMTSLRTIEGMEISKLQSMMNEKEFIVFYKTLAKYFDKVEISDTHIALNNEGMLYADGIAGDLFL
jgi:oxygen-independent coproporphyrinogen III oxidase